MTEPIPETPSKVPCEGCTACCHRQAIFLKPDMGDDPALYKTVPWDNPITGSKELMLDHKPDGSCHYLGESGCTIYETRPRMCRNYDCRKVFLTLPHKTRESLIEKGQLMRKVENAARKRISTLTDAEVAQCRGKRKEILEGRGGHVIIGDGKPTG